MLFKALAITNFIVLKVFHIKVQTIVKCKIIKLTKRKQEILEQEWLKYQFWIQTEIDLGIYSTYKQQFNWYQIGKKDTYDILEESVMPKNQVKEKDYPISISNQKVKIKKTDNKLSNYWFNFKTKSKYGGIWLPIKPHTDISKDAKIGESKIIMKGDNFYLYLTIKKEVEARSYSSVISVDLGEKVLATVCDVNQNPIFYGAEIRGVRRHYAYIRKKLGEKRLLKKIKQIGHREQNIVDSEIHRISKEIVTLADSSNSAIVLGDLKNLQNSAIGKGKRFNRILSSFAYNKLTKYIEYKANLLGIQVFKINEAYTSKTCSRCGSAGKRVNQGLFVCDNCGYRINADFNGAKNHKNRFLEKPIIDLSEGLSSENGVLLEPVSIKERCKS